MINYAYLQDPNCDYFRYVEPGRIAYVYSPNYPFKYRAGIQCRWIATCPPGYNCKLDCNDVNIPESSSCTQDRLLISRVGDPQLESAEAYCGHGSIHIVSTDQKLTVGLITSALSPGGRFLCRLSAQRVPPAPCSCGIRNKRRIVGGNETKPHEFPMMAGLLFDGADRVVCGGVVIDKRYVLTAAHCIVNSYVEEVVFGLHNQNTLETNNNSSTTQRIAIASSVVHPLYGTSDYDYDIAILKMEEDIIFNEYVSPVCLPIKFIKKDFAGDNVTVIGWGTIFFGGPTSDVLQEVTLDVISQRSCRVNRPNITSRQICTFTPSKDSCQVDILTASIFLKSDES
ncbi:unnamed protein product, partial [Brenthis ino]